jgi:hypothetical protein
MSNVIYRALFPEAPLHRRTEGDPFYLSELVLRQRMTTSSRVTRPIEPGLQQPSLVSSCEGTIDSILLSIPNYVVNDEGLGVAVRSLISSLPAGTRFTVVHHKSIRAAIERWFSNSPHADNVTYVPLADYVSFTIWAEDAYVALFDKKDGSRYLMEPWEFKRAGDALIADAVESTGQLSASQAPLIFQGGNCLIGDEFWLLGRDYFVDSVGLLEERRPPVAMPAGTPPAKAVEKLFADFVESARRLVLVGTEKPLALRPYVGTKEGSQYILDMPSEGVGTFQPIFHIDMFITLIGKGAEGTFRALVADPRLSQPVTGVAPYALAEVYDQIAMQLEQLNVEVIRNPIVHWPTAGKTYTVAQLMQMATQNDSPALAEALSEIRSLGASDNTDVTPRSWHHITWNNCLVENAGDTRRTVYLPSFGGDRPSLAPLDVRMKQIWEELGFAVRQLADCNRLAESQGVVHCIKKYLSRGGRVV